MAYLYCKQGELIDYETEINSSFSSNFVDNVPTTQKYTLYSCNLDDAPETTEGERMISFLLSHHFYIICTSLIVYARRNRKGRRSGGYVRRP